MARCTRDSLIQKAGHHILSKRTRKVNRMPTLSSHSQNMVIASYDHSHALAKSSSDSDKHWEDSGEPIPWAPCVHLGNLTDDRKNTINITQHVVRRFVKGMI